MERLMQNMVESFAVHEQDGYGTQIMLYRI